MNVRTRSVTRCVSALLMALVVVGGTALPAAATEVSAADCAVTNSTLVWGFKESFRSYISSSIANGEWTVDNGAAYSTPNFRWAAGGGSYDPEKGTGLVSFIGSITFTGHGGILNTTVADPRIRFDSAAVAHLILDVTGTTQEGAAIDAKAVDFVQLDLSKATISDQSGTVTMSGASAKLTSDGAKAFGTYTSGESFDPVAISFTIGADCAPLAMAPPDMPSAPSAPSAPLWWLLLAIPGALLVVGASVFWRRRRTF